MSKPLCKEASVSTIPATSQCAPLSKCNKLAQRRIACGCEKWNCPEKCWTHKWPCDAGHAESNVDCELWHKEHISFLDVFLHHMFRSFVVFLSSVFLSLASAFRRNSCSEWTESDLSGTCNASPMACVQFSNSLRVCSNGQTMVQVRFGLNICLNMTAGQKLGSTQQCNLKLDVCGGQGTIKSAVNLPLLVEMEAA